MSMIHNMDRVRVLELPRGGDERGKLVIIEGEKDIPFKIQRAFYIFGTKNDAVRGRHANRNSEFVLVNVAGRSRVRVMDGKGNETAFCLNRPYTGLYLPSMVWKEMYDFSEDSVLLVLANTRYDPDEYIRDYDEFVKIVCGG